MHFHAVGVLYMAAIDDLIDKIEDNELRLRIAKEVKELQKRKKFGLVFEEHLPECTPLYDVPVKIGKNVALKNGSINDTYTVLSVDDSIALCLKKGQDKPIEFAVKDLVVVATFGEPIYPYLKHIDSVCNAPDSDLWHTLIEADNYHALQLLDYLYHGKVDCIYIDPPYNTGAKDWKYNNNYVDGNDAYRHSKWLSFMKKRLELAKKLLNPKDSVLIVTIDEKEYLHLGCLLEELFPYAKIQMVSITINPSGAVRKDLFARADEFAYFVLLGNAHVIQPKGDSGETEVRWWYLRRLEYESRRGTVKGGPAQFYPIYINPNNNRIEKIGNPLPHDVDRSTAPQIEGLVTVFPINDDGLEMNWGVRKETLERLLEKKVVRVFPNKNQQYQPFTIKYLSENFEEKIIAGRWKHVGEHEDGSKLIVESGGKINRPTTVWTDIKYVPKVYGTSFLKDVLITKSFSYPKSIYAVKDCINYFVAKKPSALIVDFFAGSGTTLNSINLLNKEDGGTRRCIMITNNEVSEVESNTLINNGYQPSDYEWEKLGIARHVTWPRTKCSIMGVDINGESLEGNYFSTLKQNIKCPRTIKQIVLNASILSYDAKKSIIGLIGKGSLPQSLLKNNSGYLISAKHTTSVIFDLAFIDEYIDALLENDHITDIFIFTDNNAVFKKLKQEISDAMGPIIKEEPVKIPMAEGFKANCAYFKLGFLDKTAVKIGRQFREILPLLWMKSGSVGVCPQLEGDSIPNMLVFPENHFAVLVKDSYFADFKEQVEQHPEIDYVYIVTDYEDGYRAKISNLNVKNTFQLYSDYLDNFDINYRRNIQ